MFKTEVLLNSLLHLIVDLAFNRYLLLEFMFTVYHIDMQDCILKIRNLFMKTYFLLLSLYQLLQNLRNVTRHIVLCFKLHLQK